ncbi:hypothetical protein Tco_0887420 [Tanacetum coccineum]
MTTKAQQIALDNALVASENQQVIGKCNMKIKPGMKPKEPTYQVVLVALALTTCYLAFLITAQVPIPGQEFNEIPSEEETLSFIRELGLSREIKYITDVILDHLHQPWRTFASIINKYLSGKVSGAEPPKPKRIQKKSNSTILYEETSSKKKPAKAKKDMTSTKKPTSKPKSTKKKAPVKADRGKRVPDEQQGKISNIDEGTGNSREEDDDDEDTEDDDDNDGNDDGDDNDDDDDDDNDGNDDDDSDHERNESDRDENHNLNQSNDEHEEEEYVDEFTDKEDDANNANEQNEEELDDSEELYKDVNVNKRKEDVEMTDADQSGAFQHNVSQESGFEQEEEDAHVALIAVHDTQKTEGLMQSSYVSSDFTEKLLNFENVSPADIEIASLMDTTIRHEKPSGQTSSLYTVPVIVIPKITSNFTKTIPPPPPSFNPLLQQATPTLTPTASEVTTLFLALLDFASVFRFNNRVTNLERDLSEMKQVDQYAQAISLIPAIIDTYIDNKQREAIQQAIKSHTAECREEALVDRKEYIDLIDTLRNVTESLEVVVLAKSSSQPKSTYEAAASLFEFELTKILMDKMEEHKSYLRVETTKTKIKTPLLDPTEGQKEGIRSAGKSAHTEELSHIVDDSGVQQTQEFDMGNNDEQPYYKAVSKSDCNLARAEKPHTSFDELINTPIDFSAFVMNRLNIANLTQEFLVGPTFNLLKGTYWHNPEGKQYPFDLRKPLPLIPNHQGRHVILFDYFINNDLEYLKGSRKGSLKWVLQTKTKAATGLQATGLRRKMSTLENESSQLPALRL